MPIRVGSETTSNITAMIFATPQVSLNNNLIVQKNKQMNNTVNKKSNIDFPPYLSTNLLRSLNGFFTNPAFISATIMSSIGPGITSGATIYVIEIAATNICGKRLIIFSFDKFFNHNGNPP